MNQKVATSRKYLRLKPEKSIIVELKLSDEKGDYSLSGLLVDESMEGCAIATIAHQALIPNTNCEVKFPKCNSSEMKIVRVQQLLSNLILVGCEYLID